MASHAVMKLSWKWRSGMERLRVGFSRPSDRGENAACEFGNDESVAAQCHQDLQATGSRTRASWRPSTQLLRLERPGSFFPAFQCLLRSERDQPLSLGSFLQDRFGFGARSIASIPVSRVRRFAPASGSPLGAGA